MRYHPVFFLLLPIVLAAGGSPYENRPERPRVSEIWRWKELTSLDNYQIKSGYEGKEGVLWFIVPDGLIEYNGRTISEHPIPQSSMDDAIDLFISSEGTIFIIKETGLVVRDGNSVQTFDGIRYRGPARNVIAELDGDRFLLVDPEGGLFEYSDAQLTRIPLGLNRLSSLLVDSNNNLWLVDSVTREVHVYRLDEVADAVVPELIRSFAGHGGSVYEPRLFEDSLGRVWVIDPDEEDNCFLYDDFEKKPAVSGLKQASLWSEVVHVAESASGDILFSVRRRLGSFDGQRLTLLDIRDYPIPSSPVYMRILSSQKLLLGGYNLNPQLIDLSDERWKTYFGLNFQCEDNEGNRWYLSYDRKVVLEKSDEWMKFGSHSGLIDTPNRVIAGSDGSVWASGSHQGSAAVAYFLNGAWHRSVFPEAGETFSHLAALETTDGLFIFGCGTPMVSLGTRQGGGVIFERKGEEYTGTHLPPPVFLPRTATMAERRGDGLYMGEGFVAKAFSSEQITAKELGIFDHQWIDHMLVDSNNHLWVACLGIGVYQFDGIEWKLHGPEDGLTNRSVIHLLEDRVRGFLFALTERGFHYYDGSSWGAWHFLADVPFRRENSTLFQCSDGAIWINFSTRAWFLEGEAIDEPTDVFKTIRYLPDRDPPETFVTLSGTKFPEGSQILVQFAGVDYWDETPDRDIMFSWRLNDQAWSDYSSDLQTVLSDLKPGNYTFAVKARDKVGNEDPVPAIAEFTVTPLIWKQPGFILGISFLLVLIAYLGYALFRVRVKAALALDHFKLDFFTNISHELRNPLAVILAPAQRLLSDEKDTDKRKSLEIILRNARKMQGMVDQLLQFRKIEKGKWMINPSGGEVVSFLRDELSNLEPMWKSKGQRLEMSFPDKPCLSSFDPQVLRTVVSNLLSNAVKYSGEGSRIGFQARIDPMAEGNQLVLQVEDEGVGIPVHEQENIFTPFYRIKDKNEEVGSGIGLALVNQLVRLCGGGITVESPLLEGHRGSRFTVTIPLDPIEEDKPRESPPQSSKAKAANQPLVLVVEDNADFRHVLARELEGKYRVIEADNGVSGFKRAHAENPDLIVSDVMMPEMGGFQFCEKIKTDPETSHIPIILLTAKSADEHRIKGLKIGADAYISKPLNIEYLIVRIENLLKTRHDLRVRFLQKSMVQPSDVTVTPVDELILQKAIRIVDENMTEEDFDINQFSRLMGMSNSSLLRKLKAIVGLTPLNFIQDMRLKRAASMLAQGGISVSDAASRVGMYNLSYFSKVFRKKFGVVPSEYKGQVQKESKES